jgi:nitrogenase molybdenum-iron protein beta chain
VKPVSKRTNAQDAPQRTEVQAAADRIYQEAQCLVPFTSHGEDPESIDSPLIEWPRYTCAIGAQQSVIAIPRAVPILHSGPGCSTKVESLIGQGKGYAGGNTIPCTNSGEAEVIYGGEERLRGVIEGTFKVIDADLYVVLTGCTSDIVGDDVASVVGDYQLEGRPIVYTETGGFKSNNYISHELVINNIIDQYVDLNKSSGPVRKGLVNVFASVPYQDPFWNGNLEEYKRVLEGIGLEVNILFGLDARGIDEWHSIPEAQLNIVISAWCGLGIVEHLQQRYQTPYLHFPHFPIGARDTSLFLRQVIDAVGFNKEQRERAERFIAFEENKFYAHIDTLMDFLLEFRYGLPRKFYTLLDASYSLGFTRFLLNEAGIKPAQQFVFDDTPEQYREAIRKRFGEVSHLGLHTADVSFLADAGIAHDLIRTDEINCRSLIVGSSWERQLASDIGADLLIVSPPIVYRTILGATYVGYRGGIRIAEDLYTLVLNVFR